MLRLSYTVTIDHIETVPLQFFTSLNRPTLYVSDDVRPMCKSATTVFLFLSFYLSYFFSPLLPRRASQFDPAIDKERKFISNLGWNVPVLPDSPECAALRADMKGD